MKLLGPEQKVPLDKHYHVSTRHNSQYKWQQHAHRNVVIVGALEVPSEPYLNIHASQYFERRVETEKSNDDQQHTDNDQVFDHALENWKRLKLHQDFVSAAQSVPVETSCCGLVADDDATLRTLVPHLNETWIVTVNERLSRENAGFQLDVFLWNWSNVMGKSQTNILLIRFMRFAKENGTGAVEANE
ncbi:hypothetical protein MPSEU_000596100 [Mayamaea pseudoterrestris]|nr:hypothetical protein MPSEU_000596100 [Mayamaea pseudoterrestris]